MLSNFQFLPPAEAKNVPHCLEVSGSVAVGFEQPSRTSQLHITLNISANYSQLIEIKETQWLRLPEGLYIATQPLHFALVIKSQFIIPPVKH